MSDTEGTTPDWDRLLDRFGDAYAAAYVEQTNASDARRTAAADAIRAAVASLTQDRDRWKRKTIDTEQTLGFNRQATNAAGAEVVSLRQQLAAARERAQTVVAKVRALHQDYEGRCSHCVEWCDCLDHNEFARIADCTHGNVPWPCPTISSLDAATAAPQPKDAKPDRSVCGHCGHTPNWHVDGYARCRHSRGQDRCDCPGFGPQPAAAVPLSGVPMPRVVVDPTLPADTIRAVSTDDAGVVRDVVTLTGLASDGQAASDGVTYCDGSDHPGQTCDEYDADLDAEPTSSNSPVVPCNDATHTHCNDIHCGCGCHEPEGHEEPTAFGGQDTAADEPTVFCPRTGQIGTGDDGCAPGTHQPQPSQADLFRALVGADPQSATAGGTASSDLYCRCEYEDGDGIDCPVHPDPEPVEASSEQGRTCRECGHTADDHHPAEGSIKPIGCQRLRCECSFTLLGEANHG